MNSKLILALLSAAFFLIFQQGAYAEDKVEAKSGEASDKADKPQAGKTDDDGMIDISKTIRVTVKSSGSDHVSHTINSDDGKFKFLLSASTAGAVLLSDFQFYLKIQPKGVTLSMAPEKPVLSPAVDVESGKLKVMLNKTSEMKDVKLDLPDKHGIVRFAMRQRDQMGLYAMSADGKELMLIWLGTFDYIFNVPEFGQYKLCKDLVFQINGKEMEKEEVDKGIQTDCLDEMEFITVRGVNPLGKGFTHKYKVDYDVLEGRIDESFRHLFHYLTNK
ncbi:MAG TPA: hypothetical protein DCZ94_04385 [Lentisphaeria bacterium]|nr:MAG: hypothetical protein A2X48_20385 [Lentisphaerae bacterium GWF2_49_21]HBC86174.1 hypothetical protein [Lentisphaeria bacterium]